MYFKKIIYPESIELVVWILSFFFLFFICLVLVIFFCRSIERWTFRPICSCSWKTSLFSDHSRWEGWSWPTWASNSFVSWCSWSMTFLEVLLLQSPNEFYFLSMLHACNFIFSFPASLHNPLQNFLLYQEMERSGCTEINYKNLAESLKSLGITTITNLYSEYSSVRLTLSYDFMSCTLI